MPSCAWQSIFYFILFRVKKIPLCWTPHLLMSIKVPMVCWWSWILQNPGKWYGYMPVILWFNGTNNSCSKCFVIHCILKVNCGRDWCVTLDLLHFSLLLVQKMVIQIKNKHYYCKHVPGEVCMFVFKLLDVVITVEFSAHDNWLKPYQSTFLCLCFYLGFLMVCISYFQKLRSCFQAHVRHCIISCWHSMLCTFTTEQNVQVAVKYTQYMHTCTV